MLSTYLRHAKTLAAAMLFSLVGVMVGTVSPALAQPAATITTTIVNVAEGDTGFTPATVLVTLSDPVTFGPVNAGPDGVTLSVTLLSSSATSNVDFVNPGPQTIFIAPGTSSTSLTVQIRGDTEVEPDEVFLIRLAGVVGGVNRVLSVTATIRNDDGVPAPVGGLPNLSVTDSIYFEGASGSGAALVIASLSAPAPPGGVTFTFSTADGTATAGSDYTARSNVTVTIPAGARSTQTPVFVNGDTAVEPDETILVNILSATRATIVDNQGVITIINDDGIPEPAITIGDVSAFEGNTGATTAFSFPVTLSSPAGPAGISFDVELVGQTATLGSDFLALLVPNVRLEAGATSGVVVVNVVGDAMPEADETFEVRLVNPRLASLARGTAIGTIRNDDVVAAPTISVADVTQAEGNSGTTNFQFTVQLSAPAGAGGVSFTPRLTDGQAVSGGDFNPLPAGPIQIPAGASTATFSVGVIGDTVAEIDETFRVTLESIAGATAGRTIALGTIINDDGPLPVVSLAGNVSQLEGSGTETPFVFTVNSNLAAPPGGLRVNYTVTPNEATPGQDYTEAQGSPVVIPAGATSTQIVFNVRGDFDVEPDERFIVSLAPASASAQAQYTITNGTAVGTIRNDDMALPNLRQPGQVSINEGDSGTATLSLTYTLSAPAPAGGVTFDVSTQPETGAPTVLATAGTDYVGFENRRVTIPEGQSSVSVDVSIIGDTLYEFNEAFRVRATNLSGARLEPAGPEFTVVIIANNDPVPVISLNNPQIAEGNSGTRALVFTATLSAASGLAGEVSFATQGGTATAGVDYTASSGRLTFAPGETQRTIEIPIIGDTLSEANETIQLQVLNPVNVVIVTPTYTGTIIDDDFAVSVGPPTLPNGRVGVAYGQFLIVTGGTGPYTTDLSGGALPPGLSLTTGGLLVGTPTAGGTFTFQVRATDSTAAPAGPFSVTRDYTLVIDPAQVVLPAASLPPAVQGRAYQGALTPATGGTAPYSYVVTGGALPAGVTLDRATGALSGMPTAVGAFGFTVTVTDSSTGTGPFSTSQSYAIDVNPEPPVASASTLSVAYNAAPTPVPLALSGGRATSVALVTAPANGSVGIEGTQIIYQPRAGFSGTDSFTYTASNAGGTSAPATVTVTVRPPEFTVTAVGELAGTAGVPFSLTFEFAGGTAPFSGYQVTGLPAGVSITGTTATSVTVSGTPTAVGSFAIEATARDSSTGDGPFTVTGTATLTMAPPVLVLQPGSPALGAAYATAFSQAFTATGGSGSFSYVQTGTLPPGLTFNGATGTLSGTPTASGSYSFTITATDRLVTGVGAPFSVARTYTLAVAAPVITVTPTTLPGATAGRAYSATLVAAGAIGPYSFTLVNGPLPPGITLSSAGVFSGTPTASGSFPLTLRVRDANGETGTVNLTLTVAVPALTITPAVLPEANQGLAYSQTITASGGIAPYSYAVSAGALPEGLTLNATTGVISGTPLGSGAASFTVTVTDSTGGTPARASVAYVLQIVARPDPARDPEVQALTQSQVQSVRRLGDAQIGNFRGRLGWLRPGNGGGSGGGSGGGASLAGGGGFQNSVRIMAMDPCAPQANSWSVSPCARALGSAGVHGLSGFGAGPFQLSVAADGAVSAGASAVASAGASAGASDGSPPATGGTGVERPWSVWASGTIRYGDVDPQTGVAAQTFEADGLTLGADYRYSDRLAVGVGLGFGNDIVTVGTNGSRSRTQAVTAATYGSYLLGGGFFTDWVVGYQWLDLDLRRHVTSTGAIVRSTRSGTQLFVSASAGADVDAGRWRISPYGRFDIARGSLDAYRENSGSLFDLSYGEQSLDYAAVGVGSTFRTVWPFEGGQFLPQLSLEYLYDLDRQEAARVGYVERSNGAFSTIALTGIDREQLSVGLGFEVQWDTGSTVGLDYLTRFSSGIGSDETWQLNARFQF